WARPPTRTRPTGRWISAGRAERGGGSALAWRRAAGVVRAGAGGAAQERCLEDLLARFLCLAVLEARRHRRSGAELAAVAVVGNDDQEPPRVALAHRLRDASRFLAS